MTVPLAMVNGAGDLVCPHCACNIITPSGVIVIPAMGACPVCKFDFLVDWGVANLANRRVANLILKEPGGNGHVGDEES